MSQKPYWDVALLPGVQPHSPGFLATAHGVTLPVSRWRTVTLPWRY